MNDVLLQYDAGTSDSSPEIPSDDARIVVRHGSMRMRTVLARPAREGFVGDVSVGSVIVRRSHSIDLGPGVVQTPRYHAGIVADFLADKIESLYPSLADVHNPE